MKATAGDGLVVMLAALVVGGMFTVFWQRDAGDTVEIALNSFLTTDN